MRIEQGDVWRVIERQSFTYLAYTNASGQARSAGVVSVSEQRRLYFSAEKNSWKAKHLRRDGGVSVTVPVARPLLAWLPIPPVTITFQGRAERVEPSGRLLARLYRGLVDEATTQNSVVFAIEARSDFITYGLGVPIWQMGNPAQAQRRVSIG